MHPILSALRNALLFVSLAMCTNVFAEATITRVRLQTNVGAIVLELDARRAPLTVANFLQYVSDGHYNGTIFHRVITGFVIQGGGYTDKHVEKPGRAEIVNESGNGLSNRRGSVAMARTDNPHSARAQFYINLADNAALDPQPTRWGYTVFGQVVEGMEVVQKIADSPIGRATGAFQDAPAKSVIIEKAEIL